MKQQVWEAIVPAGQEGTTLYGWLRGQHSFSRRFVRRIKERGRVTVNGADVFWNMAVQVGDQIRVEWTEDPGQAYERRDDLQRELLVIEEDEDWIVVCKPSGMLVHPVGKERGDTLLDWLQHRLPHLHLRAVHRLDRETSGVVVFAKHALAHMQLAIQFTKRTVDKRYVAWIDGKLCLPDEQGYDTLVLDGAIQVDPNHYVRRMVVPNDGSELVEGSGVFSAHTEVKLKHVHRLHNEMEEVRWVSEVAVKPLTGRTHQIRVHLASAGYPLLGDELYGGPMLAGIAERVMLHALSIRLQHPRTAEWHEFECPLPEDWIMI